MTIKKFEKGKYYRWVGKGPGTAWNMEAMSFVLDGKPHLCTKAGKLPEQWDSSGTHNGTFAAFENRNGNYPWDWRGDEKYFEEVKATRKNAE
jgi:hypothetical protein